MYALSDYDYPLPEELIAQVPLSQRDQSRLLVLQRKGRKIEHCHFEDLLQRLLPGDLLVVNNTRVILGRLFGKKETGGKTEVLLLDYPGKNHKENVVCQCLVKASKPPRPGSTIHFDGGVKATVLQGGSGLYEMAFHFKGPFDAVLKNIGRVPLPPYIKRNGRDAVCVDDQKTYQTVYAKKNGAVAAPTAGLHFSQGLLDGLAAKGIGMVAITLHVGYGTFLPVRVSDIRKHAIHSETYELTAGAASAINEAKAESRRVIAVGTTSVRVLEFAAAKGAPVKPGSGQCDLFIYPGFDFKVIDGLITNFHLPQSTLLMLVSAFAGRKFILHAYEKAVSKKYRFYSYGDAMLIL
jgi:S-adenosylmethionine:tRNA ribosyltransferase-isomerase